MKKMGSSILIASLNQGGGAKLAEKLADALSLHFADCKEIIEYDLFDSEAILDKCGIAYLEKREKSVMKNIAIYENSVIFIDYDLFKNNHVIFKNMHPFIYLAFKKSKLTKADAINKLAYDERDAFLREQADLVVEVGGKGDLEKILALMQERL